MVRLDYEEFKEFCIKNVVKALGEDKYEAVPILIHKTDEIAFDSVQIVEKDMEEGRIPSFRIEPYYEAYCGGKALGQVLRDIVKNMEELLAIPIDVVDLSIFRAFDNAKNNLIIRPISYTDNKKLLEEHVYKPLGDVAVVLYMLMQRSSESMGTAKLSKITTDEWGLSDDFLLQVALENTASLFPPFILPFERAFQGAKSFSQIPIQNKLFMNPLIQFELLSSGFDTYVLGIDKGINGASAVFYPGALERIASFLNDDLYLALPCIREAMVHPVAKSGLNAIHRSAKKMFSVLDPMERLTPYIYHYSRPEQKLRMLEVD